MKSYILAGGKSTRMGQNKALLRVGDKLVIEHVLAAIPCSPQEIAIITNTPDQFAFLGKTMISDIHSGVGPLAGIHAGLLDAASSFAFFIACDLPLIKKTTIVRLLSKHREQMAFALRSERGPEPLCAIYSKSCLPVIEQLIVKKIYSVQKLLSSVKAQFLDIADSDEVLNLNRPEDLDQFKKNHR